MNRRAHSVSLQPDRQFLASILTALVVGTIGSGIVALTMNLQ